MNVERLARLVDAHAAALELFAGRWTSAPEDCVQEAFIELAGCHVEPRNVAAWLYRVVRNRALNAARSEQRRRNRERAVARLRPAVTDGEPASTIDALAAADALERLSQESSEIVVLRIWADLSFEDIAQVLDCSVSTAHRRYRRALEQLRGLLEAIPCPRTNEIPNRDSRPN